MEQLREGAFGKVTLVKHKDSGELFAMKFMNKEHWGATLEQIRESQQSMELLLKKCEEQMKGKIDHTDVAQESFQSVETFSEQQLQLVADVDEIRTHLQGASLENMSQLLSQDAKLKEIVVESDRQRSQAKLPHKPFGPAASDRCFLSAMWNHDHPEMILNIFLSEFVPFRVPQLYYADIAASTTNFRLDEVADREQPVQKEPAKVRTLKEETPTSFGDDLWHFQIHELIGQGGFGSVYRCILTRTDGQLPEGEELAVKVIDANRIALLVGSTVDVLVPRLLREAEIMFILGNHSGIVGLHGVFHSPISQKIYLLYEYVRGGDLFSLLIRRRKPLGEVEARQVMSQIAAAVAFGHNHNVAHRDLKMDNTLVSDVESWTVKLCDYGQSAIMDFGKTSKTLTSTAAYTAPDVDIAVRAGTRYDAFKADAFSLGVLLYGVLCNALPSVQKGTGYKEHPMWSKLSSNAQDLIGKLLSPDPDERLSVEELEKHPWFNSASANSSPLSATSTLETHPSETEQEMLLKAHEVVIALQRERGMCLWAQRSSRFVWHVKYTDSKFSDVFKLLECVGRANIDRDHSTLTRTFQWARKRTTAIRKTCENDLSNIDIQQVTSNRPEIVNRVVGLYNSVVSALMRAIGTSLPASSKSGTSYEVLTLRHKLLMLTVEQLGCERALLCGYLHDQPSLTDPQVACRISQVIGARKLLLGSCVPKDTSDSYNDSELGDASMFQETGGIVAGGLGLFPALGLTDAQLLDSDQLARLESAEDRALSLTSQTAPAPELSEWYWLLTKLIDKIHERIVRNIVDHFHPPS